MSHDLKKLVDFSEENAAIRRIREVNEEIRSRKCVRHPDVQMFAIMRDVGPVCRECAEEAQKE